ncbi:MAG: hypothetical protein HWQ38_13085 [Nostoc sp. NMS7]|uniref:hypothetical protein n=1 Tax=Nostoc sp. NMS7 TaxID=2815391 RepID=UPI0025CC0CF2|nr:hypothetical protein [Nostoc sp. NMS7]MBN3947345.1 hypothetical protein [Nostoc sp. NMS7]
MKRQRLNYFFWQGLLLTTSIVFINKPVRVVALLIIASKILASNQQILAQLTITKSVAPIKDIRHLNQVDHPLTNTQKLVQSPIFSIYYLGILLTN